MKIAIVIPAVIFSLLGYASASMYCTQTAAPNSTDGPPLPVLPDQYMTVIEANIVDRNMTVTAHEYFDNPGDRATLQMYQNKTLHNLVFDYKNNQLFYVTGDTCSVSDLAVDDNNILFGNVVVKGVPHVFTSGGALHFAKSFGEKYMGQEMVRGIMCDKWRSCLYWPQLNSNFTLDYYFTAKNWSDPVNYPQIPVRALAQGVQGTGDGGLRNFTHFYDYIDFKPVLPDDLSIFETPKGVVCAGRKLTKKLPTLPNFYHYRQEIIVSGTTKVFQADVWYDKEYRYIRYDYRTTTQVAPLFTLDPVTEIHDYNYGIRYVKDQVTGRCVSQAISNSSFDVGENSTVYYQNGSSSYVIHMKDPMELFYLDSTYAYTGQRSTRGLLCNVFTANRKDYPVPGFGKQKAVFEYYFLADGFREYPDDGSTSPQDVPIYLEVTVPGLQYHVMYNFVDFDEEHPAMSLFDISTCFSESSKLQFMVRFPGSYKTGTSGLIKASAARTFRDIMGVSALRVQDVRLDYDNSQLYISATLIDRSPFLSQFTFLSAREVEHHGDKVFPNTMVSNVSDCSRLCVTNPEFVCNGFDFCSLDPKGICRLSKSHVGDHDAVLLNSSTCDHFSRTVNGPTKQEMSILEAYTNLQKAVYNAGVEIDIPITGLIQPVRYVAVDIKVTFGWLTQKSVPSLSGQFSYHLEITVPKLKAVFNSHIYYDSDYKLVRYDLVNTQPSPPMFTVDPISTIHDYSSGLAYTLDKKEGNCTIAPITNNSFDVGFAHNAGFVVKMKSPLQIFYLNGTYRYAGQRTIRGMLCDVFEDHRTDFKFGSNPMPQMSVFQFYFMSDDWKELSEDNGAAVNSQPIALVISSAAGGFTLTYNFYDFSEQHPDLSNFDIRPCYAGNQQRHFLIKFQGHYYPTLDIYLKTFTKNVQQQMSFVTTASFLRFQDPQITYDDSYVYYLATMVEQAPYLLDFTKTSNNVGIYPADKTVNNVKSDIACAALCRKEDTFDCESFDYCASAMKCQLSKKHSVTSGPATRLSQICDHYSKTVDEIAPVEPTVDEAFVILKNYVYETGLNISIHNFQDGTNTVYHAVLFDQDILRPDSTATTSVNLKHFVPSRAKVIIPQSDLQFTGMSVDQCAARCLTEATVDCQSFDYCFDTGRCFLSRLHPDQNLTLVQTNLNCDLYARSYLDSYTAYPGQTLKTSGDTVISNIMSSSYCAKLCSTNKGYPCKSFDFCPSSNTCMLKRTHMLDVSKAAITTNSVCTHFSKLYVHDFDVTKKRTMTGSSIHFTNVSNDGCAKLCVENSKSNCQAFTYCRQTAACTINTLAPSQNINSIKTSATCDLYTRKYFPGQTRNGGNSAPQQQANTSTTTGYTGGAMAGLAVGMLIPGMVIGAALLYFIRTKRLVEEEQMRMGFVNMGHDHEDDFNRVRKASVDDNDSSPSHIHEYDSPH